MSYRPLRFDTPIYPVWRRRFAAPLKALLNPVFEQVFPVKIDRHPPAGALAMAQYLHDWGIVPDESVNVLARDIETCPIEVETVDLAAQPRPHDGSPVRIPAQWEQTERVLVRFGTIYPPLWSMHAEIIEAIAPAATVEILVTSELFARAVSVYLRRRDRVNFGNLRWRVLPTNDIWIRDYGPIVGFDRDGQRVVVKPVYAMLPNYPQQADDDMPVPWAAHENLPLQPLALEWEGGNLWTDGRGTLITSEQTFYANRYIDRERLINLLHQVFEFEKLIITPRLPLEETGHVDMLVKLASADTVLVSAPEATTGDALRATRRLFERATNAAGARYQVLELPTPPLYFNWLVYPIRRSYTNALTVNGRVLVPIYGLETDETALRVYEAAMPGYEIIPIDSRTGIHGGGAVHCMTKEIP